MISFRQPSLRESVAREHAQVPGTKQGAKRMWTWGILLFCCLSFTVTKQHKTTLYMIGDSTMADKSVGAYPETGWGMPFRYFFDSTVRVDNRARNGRSTRTFIEEGRWASVLETLAKGDYVFIEFGHNDEVPSKRSYTTQEQFVANLKTFIKDTRAKGATPVLLTPVARRHFDSGGALVNTHPIYGPLVVQTARQTGTLLIDLGQYSMDLLRQLGPETSKLLYNHLAPGEHPHYPKGVHDNTHFNELGARKMAEIVLREIRRLDLPVSRQLSAAR